MALVINDRVKENSTTTGTGAIALGGVPSGQGSITFATGIGNDNPTYYCIFNQGTAQWEVGLGTLDATSANLARTTILDNSEGNTSAITLSSGTKDVFCTLPASKAVYLNASGNTVNAAGQGFAIAMAVAL